VRGLFRLSGRLSRNIKDRVLRDGHFSAQIGWACSFFFDDDERRPTSDNRPTRNIATSSDNNRHGGGWGIVQGDDSTHRRRKTDESSRRLEPQTNVDRPPTRRDAKAAGQLKKQPIPAPPAGRTRNLEELPSATVPARRRNPLGSAF